MKLGTQIGDYALLQELGFGLLGTTYLAQHNLLKRKSILKILDHVSLERFEQHIGLLSALSHPHIAHLHNASFIDGRVVVISEEIVDAQGAHCNLEEYIHKKRGELLEDEIVRIAQQLASALDYAHQLKQPISHNLIKLSNISILEKEDGPHAVFTDFGLASLIEPDSQFNRLLHLTLQKNLTRAQFYHHFSFASPEQKKTGISHPQNDIYAFGVLLYTLLVGESPDGYFDLPSKRLGEPKWNWDLLISKCLQTDPAKRPLHLYKQLDELLKSAFKSSDVQPVKPLLRPQQIARPSFDADPAAIFHIESAVGLYKPKNAAPKEVEPLLTEMAIIPGGAYQRGSNQGGRDEMPRHTIELSSFAIDIHPVTNEQFVRFLEVMGGEKDVNNNDMIRLKESRIKRSGSNLNIESGYAKHPVVGVTWYGALAYTKWVGKRLPTEAEWEIAAYGGHEHFLYPTGDQIEKSQANFFSSDTTPVMSYPPNGYGLFDMVGNVYEWCNDWYDFHYYNLSVQEPKHPQGPVQGVYRVLRGGCWKSLKEDLRCAHRHRNNPGLMNSTYGFRCAADVE